MRNRSEGWSHAKLSGHAYEDALAEELNDCESRVRETLDATIQSSGRASLSVADASPGKGRVTAFDGASTASKADVACDLVDGTQVSISVKKSDGGQVQLIQVDRFLACAEYWGACPSPAVHNCLRLFVGATNGQSILQAAGVDAEDLRGGYSKKHGSATEVYQNALQPKTLNQNRLGWDETCEWFTENMNLITQIVFSQGMASCDIPTVELLHYQNRGDFLSITSLAAAAQEKAEIVKSTQYATIQLPWGFLQKHRPGRRSGEYLLQFHHKREKVEQLIL
jgi:hypothetical protein